MSPNTEIIIDGDLFEEERISTGLYSLDAALGFQGKPGMPLRALYEIYGNPGAGKSSLALYMAGRIRPTGKIAVADLEYAYRKNAHIRNCLKQAGFSGTLTIIPARKDKKPRLHGDICDDAICLLGDPSYNAIVLDSVGMYRSAAEMEAKIGERTVGGRAFDMAQLTRKALAWLQFAESPKAAFLVNHVQSIIGGRGHTTPGGETKKYGAGVRLWMYRYSDADVDFAEGGFLAEMALEKLRYGGTFKTKKGLAFVIPGIGIHVGMTSMFDCIRLKIAKRESYIKLRIINREGEEEWKSIGRLKDLYQAALNGQDDKFHPFYEALWGTS